MLLKMERMGCDKSLVGLVLPTGYSFNLDGTSIYLTMAAAVTGGGFVTLSATLSSIGTVPVSGLTLLLGVDRFMSEARAITNLIGNGVATLVVSRSEGAFDDAKREIADANL
jgi:aerobic C4-dicarboxylate transport protein